MLVFDVCRPLPFEGWQWRSCVFEHFWWFNNIEHYCGTD
jgi:hypothetical protein